MFFASNHILLGLLYDYTFLHKIATWGTWGRGALNVFVCNPLKPRIFAL
ncbi:hypothetical protein EXIGUO9Y_340022 [Exiguobacterium oxidotolerans]|uniref:Uncharacterized protein n=1 Tax=Exiguobacterium oxidotolerans TaxID=223958 RepID=A0A653IFE2_9BACL|nr:hypothetical protein EXIGUO9Y_340022 [Exiguobacterium oxidotolerans]